jgi:hypothetical protein
VGSAVVSTAVFGVSPKTLPPFGPAPNGVGRIIVRQAGETPTRATGTVALPNPTESFRLSDFPISTALTSALQRVKCLIIIVCNGATAVLRRDGG